MKTLYALAVAAAATLGFAASSQAATVTYESVSNDPKTQLTVSDDPVNGFRFSLSTLFGNADYLGLGFNFDGILNPGTFTDIVATRQDGGSITPTLQLFGNGTTKVNTCGPGCNFNGAGSASEFDYIVRIGSNGGGQNNYVASVAFTLLTGGSLSDFSQFAVRAQSTSGPQNSIKTDLAPVPLPASGMLLLAGLAGLAVARRRKSASA